MLQLLRTKKMDTDTFSIFREIRLFDALAHIINEDFSRGSFEISKS